MTESRAAAMIETLRRRTDALGSLDLILVGGKGGVGKTTVAVMLSMLLAERRPVRLFSTDPAPNLDDLFPAADGGELTVEPFDPASEWRSFLDVRLPSILELADRGTYLDREEVERLVRLSVPGIDELMGWLRVSRIARADDGIVTIVDTAPTGHTLRLLGAEAHFDRMVNALGAMQAKHRAIVEQLTRRSMRDDLDEFLAALAAEIEDGRKLLGDRTRAAFVPVMLAEPWVVDQTARLATELERYGLAVPFTVLNRAVADDDCDRCRRRASAERGLADWPGEIVKVPRSCVPLDDAGSIRALLAGEIVDPQPGTSDAMAVPSLDVPPAARLLFVAGKGGVGKTTTATSLALTLSRRHRDDDIVLLSIDPAHSLQDVFTRFEAPENLHVEMIDTRARWSRFREKMGGEIAAAISALTPRGLSLEHDSEVLERLIEMAPPGADEIFALERLIDLLDTTEARWIVVDTAPTGHFLRLLDLPEAGGEWARELMRLLLRYRELVAPGSLGEMLLRASRDLKRFADVVKGRSVATIVVTRPERIVVAETKRLVDDLRDRGMLVAAVVANAMTPDGDCSCDAVARRHEIASLEPIGSWIGVERRDEPPVTESELRDLIPLGQTGVA